MRRRPEPQARLAEAALGQVALPPRPAMVELAEGARPEEKREPKRARVARRARPAPRGPQVVKVRLVMAVTQVTPVLLPEARPAAKPPTASRR